LRLTAPEGIRILDLAPRDIREDEPVRFVLDRKGNLALEYPIAAGGAETSRRKRSTQSTIARSRDREKAPLWHGGTSRRTRTGKTASAPKQTLAMTLPVIGHVTGTVSVTARLVRAGLRGRIDAIRDLILGAQPCERHYPIAFVVPETLPSPGFARFFRLRS